MNEYTDQQLKDELARRGWIVNCQPSTWITPIDSNGTVVRVGDEVSWYRGADKMYATVTDVTNINGRVGLAPCWRVAPHLLTVEVGL